MKEVAEVDAAQAQAEPEVPRLSYSTAKIMVEKTPLHAHHFNRLLGGNVKEDTAALLDGKIYEALIFGVADKLVILKFNDYKTEAARFARDEAIKAGSLPVLEKKYAGYADKAMAMLKGMTEAGLKLEGAEFQRVITWNRDGVNCKAVLDVLLIGPSRYLILDLKTVADASPSAIQRATVKFGWDIQHASYTEAVEAAYPELAGKGEMKFVFCEKDEPNAVAVKGLAATMAEHGRMRWARARATWRKCMETNIWPGYPHADIEALAYQLGNEEAAGILAGDDEEDGEGEEQP